ncbi:hypothetical protein T484DRAFT_1926091 [Baffinella frigidus]|nr:hypothetical protein T484DRAFT_1926091 [Cryptophyta sp. CCMP2293]
MPTTFERTVLGGGRRMEGFLPPVPSRSKSVERFRMTPPEVLPSRMQELHAESGAAGSKSEYSSPSPRRASKSLWGRRQSLPVKSPQELLAVQKPVQLFFAGLAPITYGPLSDSPAAAATPARTRSLESILKQQERPTRTRSLEGHFGWAAPESPSSAPWGGTMRRVVSSPERPAGSKALKPLPVRRNSVTKGQELPPGLRKWSHAEIVELQGGPRVRRVVQQPQGVDGNLMIRTAAEFFDLINRHKFSDVADMLGKECKWKCSDESGRTHGREAIKQHLRDQEGQSMRTEGRQWLQFRMEEPSVHAFIQFIEIEILLSACREEV